MKSFYDMMSDPGFLNEIRLSVDVSGQGIRSGKASDRQIDPQKELEDELRKTLGSSPMGDGEKKMTGRNLQKMYELAEALLQYTHWYLPIPVVGEAPLPDGGAHDYPDIEFHEVDRGAVEIMNKTGQRLEEDQIKKTSLKQWMDENQRPDGVFLHKIKLIKLFPNGQVMTPDGKVPAFMGFEKSCPDCKALALPIGSGSPGQQIDEKVNQLPGAYHKDPRTKKTKMSKTVAFRPTDEVQDDHPHAGLYETSAEFNVRDYVMDLYWKFIYKRRAAEGGGKLQVSSEPFEVVLSRDKYPHLNVSQLRAGSDARQDPRAVLDANPAVESFESWVSRINE